MNLIVDNMYLLARKSADGLLRWGLSGSSYKTRYSVMSFLNTKIYICVVYE